jgi:hypothetical protein
MNTAIVSSRSSPVTTASKKRSLVVSFDTVEIREYPMILDESRYCNSCLTLGWDSFETTMITIEDMECSKQGRQRIRSLAAKERLFILLRAGYSATELRVHLTKPDPDAKPTVDDNDEEEEQEQKLHDDEEKQQQPLNQGHQNALPTFCNLQAYLEATAMAA